MTNPNHGPGHNPNQQLTPEQIRALDPAADVIDVARDYRVSSYMHDSDGMDTFFRSDQSGADGAYELIALTVQLRGEGRRDLNDYEEQFVDHMKLESNYLKVAATVDFDALDDGHANHDAAVQAIVDDLRSKLSTATDDEKTTINTKITALENYIALDPDPDANDVPLEKRFMRAHRTAQSATDAERDVYVALAGNLSQAMDTIDERTAIAIDAYKIIAEEHPATPNDPADLTDSTLLAYRPSVPAPLPIAQQYAQQASMLHEDVLAQQVEDSRKEIAKRKSQTFRNIGRYIMKKSATARSVYGVFYGLNEQQVTVKQQASELIYNASVIEKIKRDNAAEIDDPTGDPSAKALIVARGIMEEQKRLRPETTKQMKDKWTVKTGKWMMNHKIATVAGMTLLLPLTGGSAAVGLSMSLSALAGAKMDAKFRGLRATEETLTASDLMVAASRNGGDYGKMQEFAMSDLGSNITREVWLKRVGILGAMGSIAVGGSLALPDTSGSVHGVDYLIKQNESFIEWAALGTVGATMSYKAFMAKRKAGNSGGH